MPNYIYIDLETRSEQDLKLVGAYRYIHGKEFKILLCGWAINDGPINMWDSTQEKGLPNAFTTAIRKGAIVVGHNIAGFDWPAMTVSYDFPNLPIEQIEDTMAIAGRFGLPQKLNFLTQALGIKEQKQFDGLKLIRMFCVPPFRRPVGPLWEKFKTYCKQDVNLLRKVHHRLPGKLSTDERKIWEVTIKVNHTGVPVDVKSLIKIYSGLKLARDYQLKNVPVITDGKVQTVFQVAKIKKFCKSKNVDLPNLRADTVDEILARTDLPTSVQLLLDLRATHGRSSVKKYEAMLFRAWKGRVYDGLRYYGAHTGRFSGMGTQWQNFPANLPSPEEIEDIIALFNSDYDVERDPQAIPKAKSILRAMIKAPSPNKIFSGDYSSIEYVGLIWLCDEQEALDEYNNGRDPYKSFAAHRLGIPYEEVTKEQRKFEKPTVLGAGYVLGAQGLQRYAAGWGIDMSYTEAKNSIDFYRKKMKKVKMAWAKLENAALNAVRTGKVQKTTKCSFSLIKDKHGDTWLKLTLPSHRAIFYRRPKLVQGKYGLEIEFLGMYQGRYTTKYLNKSKIIENIVQGMCRDILCEHIGDLYERGFKVITSIHDEVPIEITPQNSIDEIIMIMTRSPSWCPDLPIRISYKIGDRYAKA